MPSCTHCSSQPVAPTSPCPEDGLLRANSTMWQDQPQQQQPLQTPTLPASFLPQAFQRRLSRRLSSVRRAPSELGEISRHGGGNTTHHGLAFLNRSKQRDSSVHSPIRTRHGGGGTEDNVATGMYAAAVCCTLHCTADAHCVMQQNYLQHGQTAVRTGHLGALVQEEHVMLSSGQYSRHTARNSCCNCVRCTLPLITLACHTLCPGSGLPPRTPSSAAVAAVPTATPSQQQQQQQQQPTAGLESASNFMQQQQQHCSAAATAVTYKLFFTSRKPQRLSIAAAAVVHAATATCTTHMCLPATATVQALTLMTTAASVTHPTHTACTPLLLLSLPYYCQQQLVFGLLLAEWERWIRPLVSNFAFSVVRNCILCALAGQIGLCVRNFIVLLIASTHLWLPYLERAQSSIFAQQLSCPASSTADATMQQYCAQRANELCTLVTHLKTHTALHTVTTAATAAPVQQYVLLMLTEYSSTGVINKEFQTLATQIATKTAMWDRLSLYAVYKSVSFVQQHKTAALVYTRMWRTIAMISSQMFSAHLAVRCVLGYLVGGSIFAELGLNPNDDTAVDDSNTGSRLLGKRSSGADNIR
eukprot:994-Heterococcus_DN1.PRE.2